MSVIDTIKDRMDKLKTGVDANIRNMTADAEVRSTRLNICNSCEFLFEPTGSCTKCGCFVKAKTWVHKAKCPVGKW